ncbi:MAG: DNA polymerase-1 [Gammaproteobacteria bacterium]|jgi:DNA polymerase-1
MKQDKQKLLVLIDGSSYLFRAYHGMPKLTHNGHPTGAIYGVLNMIRKLLREQKPDYIGVIFDAKGKTFRNDIYSEYKANRPPMPDELRVQIEPLHDIIRAEGLPLVSIVGVEADDVIGTLCVEAEKEGIRVLVSTGDKDMAQLVNPNVELINTMNEQIMNETTVVEKFGVKPEQIIDYLALMGDTSDNIPGVPKVGPKTASKWIAEYGSMQAVMDHAAEIKGKVGENLRDSISFLPMSYELATIKLDCETGVQISELTQKDRNSDELATFYQQFGFNRWYDELDTGDADQVPAEPEQRNYQLVLNQTDFDQWLNRIRQCEKFTVDTETTSVNYMNARLVGISLCLEPGEACYIPLKHDYEGAPDQLDKAMVLESMKPILENSAIGKIGQNIKYDAHIFYGEGIKMAGIAEDSMLQSYVLNSTATRHNMDDLAKFYLDRDTIHFADIAGKGAKQIGFNQIELDKASDYAAEDADITLQLQQCLHERLKNDPSLLKVYQEIELPLVEVLLSIEQNGVLIDRLMLEAQGKEVETKLADIEKNIFDQAGESFNLSSPKQIQTVLYEKLGLPVIRKTPKGQPSTAEDVLEELALNYEIPALLIQHRSLNKLKSTYIDKLPLEINQRSGRIHTNYQQAVASTGRLSSTSPNLQNIPIRTEEGRRIREAFVAEQGNQILALDYSQIELRIMAHLSKDQSLLDAFEQGLDVHRATAAEVFECSLDEVAPDQRRAAKAINFGLIYGMSAFGLGKQLNIGRSEAQKYVNTYFERYPGVRNYMEDTKAKARDQGFVETVFGRRLYLPDINARNAMQRQYAERTAINAPMQGTAADIIKRAMIAVHNHIKNETESCRMIMQVHDELVFEVKATKVEEFRSEIGDLMIAAADLSVALEVDAGVGKNWHEAH